MTLGIFGFATGGLAIFRLRREYRRWR
jgi:hypothetical protein